MLTLFAGFNGFWGAMVGGGENTRKALDPCVDQLLEENGGRGGI